MTNLVIFKAAGLYSFANTWVIIGVITWMILGMIFALVITRVIASRFSGAAIQNYAMI